MFGTRGASLCCLRRAGLASFVVALGVWSAAGGSAAAFPDPPPTDVVQVPCPDACPPQPNPDYPDEAQGWAASQASTTDPLVPEADSVPPPGVPQPDEAVDIAGSLPADPAGDVFICRTGGYGDSLNWTPIAATPAGYVTGNCHDEWHLHRTIKSALVTAENQHYDGGYIFGEINGCGWIPETNDIRVGQNDYSACSDPSRGAAEFASLINCQPGECKEGDPTSNIADCPEYANIRPWGSSTPTAPPIRTVPGPSLTNLGGHQFLWRYLTRDQNWVMVHDPGVSPGDGNWVFVPRGCLAALVPSGNHHYYIPT